MVQTLPRVNNGESTLQEVLFFSDEIGGNRGREELLRRNSQIQVEEVCKTH